ncbi:MAG: zinc ribbon domain-containing protein [Chloroflexi bacterium]|nr:zinc ribbon domain-containing protein [Chloroflexota bacterium]
MPKYDFQCQNCDRLARLFMSFAEYDTAVPTCPHCQSQNLKRRISRVALGKSEDARMDAMMDDSALTGLDEDDPRSIGRFMRKMSAEMGEDIGEEFNEVVDRLESGESPDSIEESMPDLGMGGDDAFSDQ